MRDPTGLRLPGFLEIQLEGSAVTVTHQAWTGAEWKAVPMLQNVCLATIDETDHTLEGMCSRAHSESSGASGGSGEPL